MLVSQCVGLVFIVYNFPLYFLVPESDLDTGSSPENDGDSAENSDTEIDNQPPHVLSQTRTVRSLHEVDTVTGLGKRVLVIRPNVLTQDKSFIIGVTVSHKGEFLN